jgi:hypothetical protein
MRKYEERGGLAPRSFAFGELLPPPPSAGSLRERSPAAFGGLAALA